METNKNHPFFLSCMWFLKRVSSPASIPKDGKNFRLKYGVKHKPRIENIEFLILDKQVQLDLNPKRSFKTVRKN